MQSLKNKFFRLKVLCLAGQVATGIRLRRTAQKLSCSIKKGMVITMKNRYLPYGYIIKNGVITIMNSEAEIIRRIYAEYLSGDSLKTIAEKRTAERTEFLPGKWNWSKNRVVRLLSNERYLGNDDYKQIIDQETFHRVQELKEKRNTQTNYDKNLVISPAVVMMRCGKCGHPTKRRNDKRGTFLQKHICKNPSCKTEYYIDDEKMNRLLSERLHTCKLSIQENEPTELTLEIRRQKNEIARMMSNPSSDTERLKTMILEYAALQYTAASDAKVIYDQIRTDLQMSDSSSLYTRKAIMRVVKEIILLNDDTIQVVLPNGQILQ